MGIGTVNFTYCILSNRINNIPMDILTQTDIEAVTWDVINAYVIPDFEKRNHNASGKWIASLGVRTETTRSVITGMDYTEYLMRGREPNKDQSPEAIRKWVGWYGANVFTPWVQNKGLNLNPYAVAYKVATEGTNVPKEGNNDFLEILKTKEVQDFIISKLSEKIKVNVIGILRDEIRRKKW